VAKLESGPLAAVDLGSNSFHLIIARVLDGELSVLDRLRDPVRMASGLDEHGVLAEETIERMLEGLRRFRQRLGDIPRARVRAIGTNTFRKTKYPRDLLQRAGAALGYPIEVLPGAEEARLIHMGVCRDLPAIDGNRLVVDVGGGSTECILGSGISPLYTESLQMGCVSFSQQHFPAGKLSRKGFKAAEIAACLELEDLVERFKQAGWAECLGSSGTLETLADVLRQNGWGDGTITLEGVKKVRRAMLEAQDLAGLDLPGLSAERAPVFAGGVAIAKAALESLGIDVMRVSHRALREGVLYDFLGRFRSEDARDRTIRAMGQRYHVDEVHANRVGATALRLLDQVATAWSLDREEGARLLGWAASLHEIGLALAHRGYHKHGAYLLANSNMPGFSREEQERLAALVRGHRRRLDPLTFEAFPPAMRTELLRLCVLLRIAVRLHRSRSTKALPPIALSAQDETLRLLVEEPWLERHPLTRADLVDEAEVLELSGFHLQVAARPRGEDADEIDGEAVA